LQFDKTIRLKNGKECCLRNPGSNDAGAVLQHMVQTSGETDFMARYSDEINMSEAEERAYLARLESDPKAILISAIVDQNIVATAGFNPVASYEKYRHRAEFGISVKKSYWGMGIGSVLLAAIIESAKTVGFEQLELEVVTNNDRAVTLYKKHGFQIYGTRKNSFRYRSGAYASEHLMLLKL
jgi:RimJ/RimL family protein N-acetyltransferase